MQLVDSVLDLGKLDAGKVPVAVEPVELAAWLAEQRDRDRLPLHDGVELAWRIPAPLPTLQTDPAKLRIVLDNLVNNAIKFTVRGAITIDVRSDGHRVELVVADTGPGIPERDLGRIFEPFHQAGDGRQGQGGVGLGLAIVDRYTQLLGGTVRVVSTLGLGTTFTVTLPLWAGAPSVRAAATAA
jgi:signal transduction histidine kinase